MAKKSKLVKLGGETVEPQVKAFPMENKKARRPVGGLLLFLSGGALLASGVILGPAAGKVPAVEEGLTKLTEIGFQPSTLMLAGTLLLALGMISRHIRLHVQTLLQRDQSERALTEMGADLAEFCNRLVEFQADHLHFRSELENIGKRVHAHHQADRSGEAADGLFRLAASLDQLGARLDAKLNEAVGSMHGGIHEMAGLVAASRDFLQESVEDNAEGIRQIQESTTGMQRDLAEVQLKTNATMQVVSKRAQAPEAPAPAPAKPEPETELLELEESMLDDAMDHGLGLLDELDSPAEEQAMVEERPLALFEDMEQSGSELEGFGAPEGIGLPVEPEPPVAEQEAAPSEPFAADYAEPEQPAAELASEETADDAPKTVPLDAPAEIKKDAPAAPAFGALPKLPNEAPQAPLPAESGPQVPPALTGGAFSLAQPKKSGPMEIDLNAPKGSDGDPSKSDPGNPPIGF